MNSELQRAFDEAGEIFKQAEQNPDKRQAYQLFETAKKGFQKYLELAEEIEDVDKQCNAQGMLGLCVFSQAKQTKERQYSYPLFQTAKEHFQEFLKLAEEIEDVENQCYAQYWLGQCLLYLVTPRDKAQQDTLFQSIKEHFQEFLRLAEEIKNLDKQCDAQFWLGCSALLHAIQTQDKAQQDTLFQAAKKHFQEYLKLAEQIEDVEKQADAQYWLGNCLYQQAEYAETVESLLFEQLFQHQYQAIKLEFPKINKSILEILTVLNVLSYEINGLPLAHYTSPYVTELLLGLNHQDETVQAQPMRMNISTYMNDPYEGKSILDFLGKTDLDLENKITPSEYAAFFCCLSSRVNDLNQFRLYGKENHIEASGCCLVFNQAKNFTNSSNLQSSFKGIWDKLKEENTLPDTTANENDGGDTHSLFQLAYLAYQDDYTQHSAFNENEVRTLGENKQFFVYLKQIGHELYHKAWHQLRLDKLEQALNNLQKQNDLNKNDLEIIRFLFKDFAFRDEEEFRCLKIKPIDAPEIQCCTQSNNLYLEYGLITDKVDEIIIGTNYEHTDKTRRKEVFRYQITKKYPDIKVSYSSLPISPK